MGKVALRLRARAALRKQLPNRFDRPGLNTFRVGSAALGADLTLGHALPLTLSVGLARGFAARGETRAYFRAGLAF